MTLRSVATCAVLLSFFSQCALHGRVSNPVNGDFETGDLTGWTKSISGGWWSTNNFGDRQYGLENVNMLVDADHEVSEAYDVLQWAVGSGEPSHTFILVDADGKIAWIRDYGSPKLDNPVMYVPPEELISQIQDSL